MATMSESPQFSHLPFEIRRKIWMLCLPGPRVMLVTRSTSHVGKYITSPASYGGKLTPLFGAYWDLDIDAPYIEATDYSQPSNTQLAEMREKGVLNQFKHLAVDWTIWNWEAGTRSMEFRCCFGRGEFDAYEHPLKSLASLPNLQTCSFIHTKHTLQKSLIKPYCAWTIGALDAENTLDVNWEMATRHGPADIVRKRDALSRTHTKQNLVPHPRTNWTVVNETVQGLNIRQELQINLAAIHDREREYLPPNKLYRSLAGWEMDWFG